MNNPIQAMYTLYAALVAVLLFLVLYPFMWLAVGTNKAGLYPLHRIWLRATFFLCGIPVDIRRNDRQARGACVYVGNHFSSLDNLAVYLLVDREFSVIGLEEIGKLPLYGPLFRRMHVLFDRKCNSSKVRAMHQAGLKLDAGIPLAVAAEGGIRSLNPPEVFQPFEDGAFILAVKKQVPLVPMVFKSTYRMLPEFPLRYFNRVPFEAEVLAPIETVGLGIKDIPQLKEEVFQQMTRSLQGLPVTYANLEVRSRWNLIRELR